MSKGLRRSLILLLISIITIGSFAGCHYSFSFNPTEVLRKADAKEFTIEKEAVESITDVEIQARLADVELIPSDHFYVEINYLYWKEEPEYSLRDGRLYFNDKNSIPNSYSINFNLDNIIKIYLPKETSLNQLDISISSGDANLSGFATEDMKVRMSYGDLTLEQAGAAEAAISLSSGDCTITEVSTGSLELTSSYGDTELININTLESDIPGDSISIRSSSGNITIHGLGSKTVTITDSYGDVTCTELKADSFTSEISNGDLNISKSDLMTTRINSSYGDANISLSGSVQDYSMDLRTSYGKIQVGNDHYDNDFTLDSTGDREIEASLSSGDIRIDFD